MRRCGQPTSESMRAPVHSVGSDRLRGGQAATCVSVSNAEAGDIVSWFASSAIGINLPPIGFCLYTASSISGVSLELAAKAILPFIRALSIDLAIIILCPKITLFLPHLAGVR